MVDVAADFSGSMPEYYDRIMGPAQFDTYAADLVRRLPEAPRGGVLEIACGTGIVARRLRQRLAPQVRLVCTDISGAMLDFARAKVAGDIEWKIADAAALPFRDAEFDAAVCAFGVMFVPDKKAAFSEARRVLQPGGSFLFNVWDGLDNNPHGRAASSVMEEMFPGDPEMKFSGPYAFNDRAAIRALLAGAHFQEACMEPVRLELRCATARDYAAGQVKGTPRGLLLQKRGVDVEAVIEKIGARLARLGGEAPFRITAQALVVEARAV
jgi:SAM-dependent methyltransferase